MRSKNILSYKYYDYKWLLRIMKFSLCMPIYSKFYTEPCELINKFE